MATATRPLLSNWKKIYLCVLVMAFTRGGWASITKWADHVSDRGTLGLMDLCKFTRGFRPVLFPSCATEDSRSGEAFQVCLESSCLRLQLASRSPRISFLIFKQKLTVNTAENEFTTERSWVHGFHKCLLGVSIHVQIGNSMQDGPTRKRWEYLTYQRKIVNLQQNLYFLPITGSS